MGRSRAPYLASFLALVGCGELLDVDAYGLNDTPMGAPPARDATRPEGAPAWKPMVTVPRWTPACSRREALLSTRRCATPAWTPSAVRSSKPALPMIPAERSSLVWRTVESRGVGYCAQKWDATACAPGRLMRSTLACSAGAPTPQEFLVDPGRVAFGIFETEKGRPPPPDIGGLIVTRNFHCHYFPTIGLVAEATPLSGPALE